MNKDKWEVGDWVIYRKQKSSNVPDPRAEAIQPDRHLKNDTSSVQKVIGYVLSTG